MDKYLFLIRCYVGVGFEVFLKPAGREEENGRKKRKRESESQDAKKKRSKLDEKIDVNGQNGQEEGGDGDHENNYPGLAAYISILDEGPLYPLDFDPDQTPLDDGAGGSVAIPHGPDGLRYHLMDIWIDELEKVLEFEDVEGEEDEESVPRRRVKDDVPMELLLRPVETLRTKGIHRPVRKRATETLEDERLVEWGVKEKKADEKESEGEDEWGGLGDD